MRYLMSIIIGSMIINVAGCASEGEKRQYYIKHAQTIKPITVPPHIKNPTATSYYPITYVPVYPGPQPSLVPPRELTIRPKNHP